MAEGNVGSFAAIFDGCGRVLIVQERREPHRFGFPGGRVEPGENPDQTVVRECEEETGLTSRVVNHVGLYCFTNGLEAHVFLCQVEEAEASLVSEDGLHVGWHAPTMIPRPVRSSLHYALPDVLAGRRDVHRTGLDPVT